MMLAQTYLRRAFVGLIAAGMAAITFGVYAAEPIAETDVAEKKPISPTETAVRKVVNQHIQGIVNADAKLLADAWDTTVGQITFIGESEDGEEVAHSGPIADSIKLWTASKRPGTSGEIQSVDVVNNKMALAKARITWNKQVFDDYLVLLNTEGQWRLVSKTYTSKRAGGSPYAFGLISP